jgi:hypothetical protein
MAGQIMAKTEQYKESLEWELECVKTRNIMFLPHGSLLNGQRERYLVVYPFVNMIVGGKLVQQHFFFPFSKGDVLAYCNMRPVINGKKDCRPDILAFTGNGDILIIEGKLRRICDGSDNSAVRRLSSAAAQLAEYAHKLKKFAEQSKRAPFQSWSEMHRAVYTELHGFPELAEFLTKGLSLRSEDVVEVISRVNQSFIGGNVQYGLAFNGPWDQELNVPGYDHINIHKIREVAQSTWDSKLGRLHLFMIDPYKKLYSHS